MGDDSSSAGATASPARLRHLDVDECLALLTSTSLGRVAFVVDGNPCIVPVTFLLHEGTVLYRTTYGTMLDAIGSGASVAFEIDQFDEPTRTGWSVQVQGRAEELWKPGELAAARRLPVHPAAPGDRDHFVRIAPVRITGRRIGEEIE